MKSLVVMVVDRSGSMSFKDYGASASRDVIATEGVNNFVKAQKEVKVNGKTGYCLIEFDDRSTDVVTNVKDIKTVENSYRLVPRGNTPLWDAIGFSVDHANSVISKIRKRDQPKGVMVIVVTDGEENRSTKHNKDTISRLIESKKGENWDFTFLCTNPMTVQEMKSAGVQNAQAYNASNMKDAYDAVSLKVGRVRNAIEQTGTFSSVDSEFTANEIRSLTK